MIIEGGSRRGAKWFAGHLMRNDGGQVVRLAEARGLAGHDIPSWFRQMEAVAFGTRCDNYFYHANLNTREDERLTEAQWDEGVDKLEHNLGLDGHARFVVEHEKNGRTHRHVFWSRIDPETMTAVSDSNNYRTHEKTADELEKAFGHAPTPRGRGPDGPNPKNYEVFRGQESGVDPYDVKAAATALWRQADSGRAFAAALKEHRLILARGDRRDFVIIDRAGDDYSLGRYVGGVKVAEVRARMRDVDRDALPSVEEARAMARERIARRKEAEMPPTGVNPDPQTAPVAPKPRGPSPFGELAEELVHAVKNGMKGTETELTPDAAVETTPFERLARNLAHGAKEAAPLAGELAVAGAVVAGEHLAKQALQDTEAPARLHEQTQLREPAREFTPFERVTGEIAAAWKEAGGDEHWMKDAEFDWLAQRIRWPSSGAPPATRQQTPFERATEDLAQATRENGGEPCPSDGQSFWQRARMLLATAHERVASWARDTLQGFVDKLTRERKAARDDQGFER